MAEVTLDDCVSFFLCPDCCCRVENGEEPADADPLPASAMADFYRRYPNPAHHAESPLTREDCELCGFSGLADFEQYYDITPIIRSNSRD